MPRTRVDELEGVRADDRRIAEQALAGLRTKAETATGRIRVVEEEMAALRGRHAMELERMSAELERARAHVNAVDVELADRREREDDLRRALSAAEHRAAAATSVGGPGAPRRRRLRSRHRPSRRHAGGRRSARPSRPRSPHACR